MTGLFGGTFDPVHLGHLHFARRAQEILKLDSVIFVPTGKNPLRTDGPRASGQDRVKMLEMALAEAGEKTWSVCDREALGKGPSFTIDTVRFLTAQHPGKQFCFLLGSDAFATLPRWKDVSGLFKLLHFGVAHRPGDVLPEVAKVVKQIPGADARRVHLLEIGALDVSSTAVRAGGPGAPRSVENYLREKAIYAKPFAS